MSRIATGTGDEGETSLFGGQRVDKDHPAVEAYGTVDEVNAILGLVHAATEDPDHVDRLEQRQRELFAIGAELATPGDSDTKIRERHVQRLETELEELEDALPQLQTFVLPTGSERAAHLHQARAACRRAERRTVALHNSEAGPVREPVRVYLNRLSDLLFLEARQAARRTGKELEVSFEDFQDG
jgi:cob(I)alamin adenosyltransferase